MLIEPSRRGFLAGLGITLAAPAIVRPDSLMRILNPYYETFRVPDLRARAALGTLPNGFRPEEWLISTRNGRHGLVGKIEVCSEWWDRMDLGSDFVPCDGREYRKADFPELAAVIGDLYP